MQIGFLAAALVGAQAIGNGADKLEYDKLRGTWLTASLVYDGKPMAGEKSKARPGPVTKLRYDGDRWMVVVADKIVAQGTFKVDASKSPKEIDLFDKTGERNAQTKLGIYEIAGDNYRYCLAPAGQPRPTEFSSKPGGKLSLGVCKREQKH